MTETHPFEGTIYNHLKEQHTFRSLPDPVFANHRRYEDLHRADHYALGDKAHKDEGRERSER